jgi:hypothetical protein
MAGKPYLIALHQSCPVSRQEAAPIAIETFRLSQRNFSL